LPSDEISSLIKFCDVGTGLKILNSQSLRWSAPALFNDPFEPDHNTNPHINKEQFLAALIKETVSMLFGANEPTGKGNRLIAAISRWRNEDRFSSEEEAEQVLQQLLAQMAEKQYKTITNHIQQWQQYASQLRICCFSAKPTNMHAWQRYGDNHNGIALKFSCGEDTSLPSPQRVVYSNIPPQITSLRQQINITYGKEAALNSEQFISKLLNKNKTNNAEREWRCFNLEENPNVDDAEFWYTNKPFSTPELKSVYFGLGTSIEEKTQIIDLIKTKYKNTRIFNAEPLNNRYEIKFAQIANH
jgi:hypothetical protein